VVCLVFDHYLGLEVEVDNDRKEIDLLDGALDDGMDDETSFWYLDVLLEV